MTVWCVFDRNFMDDPKELLFISPTREAALLTCKERGLLDPDGTPDRYTLIEEWEV